MKQLSNTNQTMSSREIADMTGKRHQDIMRAIRNMEDAWVKINGCNFALVEYTDAKGQKRPEYQLTKKESLYIATKFNDEARAILINRWEELELANQPKQLSTLDFLQHQLNMMKEQEIRVSQVENKVALLEAKTTTRPDYFTVAGFWSLQGSTINVHQAAAIGRKAVSICNKEGLMMDTIPDPRFGKVRLYPTEVLSRIFNSNNI